jgi:putative endonuclease
MRALCDVSQAARCAVQRRLRIAAQCASCDTRAAVASRRMTGDLRHRLGRAGEQLAAEHLERRGFAIVERNHRTRWGEIDLIAVDEQRLVFCEVKTRRAGWSEPLEGLRDAQQRRLRRMAAAWLQERRERPCRRELRFDAIGVTIDARGRLVALEHLEDAF